MLLGHGSGRELTCVLEGVEKGPADRQADRHTHSKKGPDARSCHLVCEPASVSQRQGFPS